MLTDQISKVCRALAHMKLSERVDSPDSILGGVQLDEVGAWEDFRGDLAIGNRVLQRLALDSRLHVFHQLMQVDAFVLVHGEQVSVREVDGGI